jgi:glutathione peroxidase
MAQSFRQKILKAIYPLIMLSGKWFGAKATIKTNTLIKPNAPFPFNSILLNTSKPLDEALYKNKKIILVNTASDCGYTKQYEPLQKLYETYNDTLLIIGFPANNFMQQENYDNATIESFCKINYGVRFPITVKTDVIGANKHAAFEWLSNAQLNGWCNTEPEWNFSKYVLSEEGMLLGYFGSGVDPLDKKLLDCLAL